MKWIIILSLTFGINPWTFAQTEKSPVPIVKVGDQSFKIVNCPMGSNQKNIEKGLLLGSAGFLTSSAFLISDLGKWRQLKKNRIVMSYLDQFRILNQTRIEGSRYGLPPNEQHGLFQRLEQVREKLILVMNQYYGVGGWQSDSIENHLQKVSREYSQLWKARIRVVTGSTIGAILMFYGVYSLHLGEDQVQVLAPVDDNAIQDLSCIDYVIKLTL